MSRGPAGGILARVRSASDESAIARAASRSWRPWRWPASKRRRTTSTLPWPVSSTAPPRRSSSEAICREATLTRLFASRRRMTRPRSEMASLTPAPWSAAGDEPLEQTERDRLRPPADLVHGADAGGTAGGTRAALERLEAAREKLGQHLEDTLGESDAARLVVVEVDGRGELVALHELGAHGFPGHHLPLGRGRAVAEPRADVANVAEQ